MEKVVVYYGNRSLTVDIDVNNNIGLLKVR